MSVKIKSACYFGDCRNTVDKDKMWDATQMSQFIEGTKKISSKKITSIMKNGDRNIPKSLLKNKTKMEAGYDSHQKIGYVYDHTKDIHHFFDIEVEDHKTTRTKKILKSFGGLK